MEQNLPSQQKTSLLRRFLPYLLRYKGILVFDLVCAGLTTLCELVLPLMLRAITNRAAENLASLTLGFILQCRFVKQIGRRTGKECSSLRAS